MKLGYFVIGLCLLGQVARAADHANENAEPGRLAAAKKSFLNFFSSDKADPNTELGPVNINDAVRAILAVTTKNIHTIENDSSISDTEKEARIKLIKEFQENTLEMTMQVRRISPVAMAFNICGGVEFNLGFIWPEKWSKAITPGFKGALCLTFAARRNQGTGLVDGIIVGGPTVMAGLKVENLERDKDGQVLNNAVDVQKFASVMIPLSHKNPKTRLGDLQGVYGGFSVETAFGTNKALLTAARTLSAGFHVRVPQLDVMSVTVGTVSSGQKRNFNFQGEALYYLTPWATDGTGYRLPFQSENSSVMPIPKSVQDKLNDPEVKRLLKSGEIDKMVKEAAEKEKEEQK